MIARKPRKKKKFEPIERSLYLGRRRLGSFTQIEARKYRSFDANHRSLGTFATWAKALAAIRKALPPNKGAA